MNCNKCGFKLPEDSNVCPFCGQPVEAAATTNTAANMVFAALKDKLFFVLCVLITANAALSLLNGSVPLLQILFAVFLWLTYASAQKGFVDAKNLRCVSGTVYAQYVILNVCSIIIMVCGVIFAAAMSLLSGIPEFTSALEEVLSAFEFTLNGIPQAITASAGWIVGLIFILAGVIILVINLLAMRKIHRLAKSVYIGVMSSNPNFEGAGAVKIWLIVLGVFTAFSAVSNLVALQIVPALTVGCEAAATVIAAILVGKHLEPKDIYTPQV